MNKILAILTLSLLSLSAFAGPEDHINDTCYTATASVPSFVNSTLCFETATLDFKTDKLILDGYASQMPSEMRTEKLVRKNEDWFVFSARGTLWENNEITCGYGEFAYIDVSGQADVYGTIDPKSLTIYVSHQVTNDSCHSEGDGDYVEYKLSK